MEIIGERYEGIQVSPFTPFFISNADSAVSTGSPGFFREFFIEKFITVNAQGNLS